MRSVGWTVIQYDWWLYKRRIWGHRYLQRPCEDPGRGWPSTSEGERMQSDPVQLILRSLTSNPQNGENIHFYCLSHLVCCTLLWQPKKINTAKVVECLSWGFLNTQQLSKNPWEWLKTAATASRLNKNLRIRSGHKQMPVFCLPCFFYYQWCSWGLVLHQWTFPDQLQERHLYWSGSHSHEHSLHLKML